MTAVTAPDVRAAAAAIHDAMDAADAGFHERERGIVDTTSDELAAALLAAGWKPPAGVDVRPFGELARIDPPDCGCTDCLTGYSKPWRFASPAERQAMLRGELYDATDGRR